MKHVTLSLIIAAAVSLPNAAAFAQHKKKSGATKWPECYCTDRYGKRHEIGDIICLTVDNRSYEAKCVMAQNNPFWRDQNRPCLSSSLPPELAPQSPKNSRIAALYE